MRYLMENMKWKTRFIMLLKMSHIVFGWLMVLFGQATIVLGIFQFASFFGISNILGIISVCVFVILVIIAEIVF